MKVKKSTKFLDKMALLSLDMICTLSRSGTIIYVSEACKNIIGYESQEMTGRHYTEFLHPKENLASPELLEQFGTGCKKRNQTNRFIHKNKSVVHLQWSAVWCEEEEEILCVVRDITDSERSRLKSLGNEQRYRVLFDNNPDIIFIESKEGLITEVNQCFCNVFGITKEQAVNVSVAPFLPPEMAYVSQMALDQALLGTSIRFDMELLTKEKERRIYDTTKHPVEIDGEVVGVQTIAKDITPIVHSYEIIQQQASKLNTIFESITDAFFMLDRNWNFTYINSEAQKLLSLNRDHDIGKNIWTIFPKEIGGELHNQYLFALKTGSGVNFTSYLKERNMWLQVKAFPSAEGLSVYFDDVTEKVKARQELEKLSLVASKTNNSVLIANKEWRIEWINEGFTRLTGYTMEEVIGKKPSDLLHNHKTDKEALTSLEDQAIKGSPISFEVLNIKKNGEDVWLSVEITAIFDESGELSGFIEVQTDITALKSSELELSKLAQDLYRQNSDLQQFTYIVSHNLRSPVANALGLADLLTKINKGTEIYDLSLLNLKQSIIQLDTVLKDVNKILSIRDSKGNLDLEQVALKGIIQQTLASLEMPLQNCGGKVIISIADTLRVKANKAYLYSIFYNLLSNAIKYRSEDRALEVHINSLDTTEKMTMISFSDNGSGFDLEKANKNVFKLYKRFHTNTKGSGIGLYLIKTHLEAMGGYIEVASEVGAGTTFRIYLPKN